MYIKAIKSHPGPEEKQIAQSRTTNSRRGCETEEEKTQNNYVS